MSALLGCLRVGAGVAASGPALLYDGALVVPAASGQVSHWANAGQLGSAYDLVPVAGPAQYVASGGYQNQPYVKFTGGDVLQTASAYQQQTVPRALLLRVWLSADAVANGRNLTGYGANSYHQLSDLLLINQQLMLHIYGDIAGATAGTVPAGQWVTVGYYAPLPANGAQPLTVFCAQDQHPGNVAGLLDQLPAAPLLVGGGRYQDFNKPSELRLAKLAFYTRALTPAEFQLAFSTF